MEKQNSVRNNNKNGSSVVIKVPIGFRFHPTDEELVVHYLSRKVYCLALAAPFIPEVDVFESNPWDLPGELREKRYFFSRRRKENDKNCRLVATGCGYWKPTGEDAQIKAAGVGTKQTIGIKRSLVFHQGGKRPRPRPRPHGITTHWIMHQYSLSNPCLTQNCMMQVGDWILCCIYQKKRKGRGVRKMNTKKIENEVAAAAGINHSEQASLSCSSEITDEIPQNELLLLEQEVSSECTAAAAAPPLIL